jgi:hypothetical protein
VTGNSEPILELPAKSGGSNLVKTPFCGRFTLWLVLRALLSVIDHQSFDWSHLRDEF